MEKEIKFVEGATLRKLSDTTPSFIKSKIDINCKRFTEWLRANARQNDKGDWWATIEIVESQKGVLYLRLDTFVPEKRTVEMPLDMPLENTTQSQYNSSEVVRNTVYSQGVSQKEIESFGKEINVDEIPF
jgi:hypothetical protein